jgi:hypothetical protein
MKIKYFNAKEHKNFHSYSDDVELQNPFTFTIELGEFILLPDPIGFKSKTEALQYSTILEDMIKFNLYKYVAVILNNADFTAGRGPMILDSVFNSPEKAHEYVMSQKGIYDSTQYHNLSYGVNIHGGLYGRISYNGYDIKLIELK